MTQMIEYIDCSKYNLFIFDLDDTLYLRSNYNYDYVNEYKLKLKSFLKYLKTQNKILTIASHNRKPHFFLQEIEILEFFDYIIGEYPRNKACMVKSLLELTNCTHSEAIFFDDLINNVKDVEDIGVKSILICDYDGINFDIFI